MLDRGKRNYRGVKVERKIFNKRNLQRLAENLRPETHKHMDCEKRNIKEGRNYRTDTQ